jgi:hypothetical protein
MTNPCNDALSLQANQIAQCPAIVHETVCVQAEVTIAPDVQVGEVRSFCVDQPVIGPCPGIPSPTQTCKFEVSQKICVEIPLTFSATATALPNGIICGTPMTGVCASEAACTHTIGFYSTHPDVTNALIAEAGGSIILGIDSAARALR